MSETLIVLASLLAAALVALVMWSRTLPKAPEGTSAKLSANRLPEQLKQYAAEMSFRFDVKNVDEEKLYASILRAWGSDYASQEEIKEFRNGEMLVLKQKLAQEYMALQKPVKSKPKPATDSRETEIEIATINQRPEAAETFSLAY